MLDIKDELGKRMKEYEAVSKTYLMNVVPKVIRLDMRSGHTFTKNFIHPYDPVFSSALQDTTRYLCERIPGAVIAYCQSDEISIIINDTNKNGFANCLFNGNVEKITSTTSSDATAMYNKQFIEYAKQYTSQNNEPDLYRIYEKQFWNARFDSRCFCLPNIEEVVNYLWWRQADCIRNSITALASVYFPQSTLQNKSGNEMKQMLIQQKNIDWDNTDPDFRFGTFFVKHIYEKDVVLPNGKPISGVKRKKWDKLDQIMIVKDNRDFIEDIYSKKLLL